MSRLQSDDPRESITFRVEKPTKDAYKAAVDSMSRDLREYVRSVANSEEVESPELPTDENLREAYLTLRESAGDNRRVPTETAETLIAQKLGRPKTSIRGGVLRPLENRGYVKPAWGVLIVREVRRYE